VRAGERKASVAKSLASSASRVDLSSHVSVSILAEIRIRLGCSRQSITITLFLVLYRLLNDVLLYRVFLRIFNVYLTELLLYSPVDQRRLESANLSQMLDTRMVVQYNNSPIDCHTEF